MRWDRLLLLTLLALTTGGTAFAYKLSEWSTADNKLPPLGFADDAKGHGLLCGVLEPGHEQGLLTDTMPHSLPNRGGTAGSLLVRIGPKGIVGLCLKTAERLGLQIPYEINNAAEVVLQ